MPDNKEKALFDPGFAPHLIPFLPAIQTMQSELSKLKIFGQKKLRFRILNKGCVKALESTLGFWVGCIMWGSYLKYRFQKDPQPIVGNDFLTVAKEEIPDYAYNLEFEVMQKYIETYAKNMQYYTGENETLPDFYLKILDEYKTFIAINDHFLATRTTADINLPEKFKLFEHYNEQQLERLHQGITHIIDKGDLSEFLTLDFLKKL